MAKANPPPHQKLPASILKNKDLSSTLEEMIFNMFLLWQKSGGGTDFIDELFNRIYIQKRIPNDKVITKQDVDYTTSESETVVCISDITVSLNDKPEDFELVTIVRSTESGDVLIDGNGRNIIGEPTYTMSLNYQSLDLLYTFETDEWLII